MQLEELSILKFQTVEQVATASDMQLQKVGMGAAGMRERARAYLTSKNQSDSQVEMEKTKQELAELKEQLSAFMAEKKVGRPKKEE
jgi:predicted N-acyltransferase